MIPAQDHLAFLVFVDQQDLIPLTALYIQQAQNVSRTLVLPLSIPVLHIVSLGVHEDPGTVIGPLDCMHTFMQAVLFGIGGEDRLVAAVDGIDQIGSMDVLGLGVKTVTPRQDPASIPGP